MRIENNLTPEQSKMFVLLGGVLVALCVWLFLKGRVEELQYQEVLGEYFDQSGFTTDIARFESLPLVEAVSQVDPVGANEDFNVRAIEAAFREPVFNVPAPVVEEVEEEPEPQGPTLVEMFIKRYRPLIGGVSNSGVAVSGTFWRFGEELKTMPVLDPKAENETAKVVYPKLIAVRNGNVIFKLGDEEVPVQFDRY